jgi:hypothetical protein
MTVDSAAFQRAQTNGTVLSESADVQRQELAELLGLDELDRAIVDVQMLGRGPAANVDVRLTGELRLRFDRFSEVTNGSTLTSHLASFGVARTFKVAQAALAGALIAKLAQHHENESKESIAREWGTEFLRLAHMREADLDDQAER